MCVCVLEGWFVYVCESVSIYVCLSVRGRVCEYIYVLNVNLCENVCLHAWPIY